MTKVVTMQVDVYHNISDRPMRWLTGYEPGDELVKVFVVNEIPPIGSDGDDGIERKTVEQALEWIWMATNLDAEVPMRPHMHALATEYRARKNRSLSMGDVCIIGGLAFTPDVVGWKGCVVDPSQIVEVTIHGTTFIDGVVPTW